MSRDGAIVQFDTVRSTDSITRPANTTAYAAGDVIGERFEFAKVCNPGKLSGLISSARITSSANQATKLDGELWLFPTAINVDDDNNAWTPTDDELASRVAVIDFADTDWRAGNANAGCDVHNLGMIFKAETTMLYGVLVARNAYEPASGEVLTVDLVITRD